MSKSKKWKDKKPNRDDEAGGAGKCSPKKGGPKPVLVGACDWPNENQKRYSPFDDPIEYHQSFA